jgi:uncharacterized Ntn-hydrolase superfamily protein
MLMGEGKTPQEVIQGVTDPAFAPNFDVLQFGVATLDAPPAGFTGDNATTWAGDVQGRYASVQGNILVGQDVVQAGLAAFEAETPACPVTLADRLMAGLEAGSRAGGDRRCAGTPSETALSAFVIVARPSDATSSLELVISGPVNDSNPVTQLRQQYDGWRATHPPDASRCTDAGPRGADAAPSRPPGDAGCGCRAGRSARGEWLVAFFSWAALVCRRRRSGLPIAGMTESCATRLHRRSPRTKFRTGWRARIC